MRRLLTLILCLTLQPVAAGDSITLPWAEFKQLYADKLRRDFQAGQPAARDASLYSVDSVSHHIRIGEHHAAVRMEVTGQVLNDVYTAFTLLQGEAAVTQVTACEGCQVLNRAAAYQLLPTAPQFRAGLELLVPVKEDRQSRYLTLEATGGVQNRLRLELPADWLVLEAPGIRSTSGEYYFSPDKPLTVRFAEAAKATAAPLPVEVDTLSHFKVQGRTGVLSLYLLPQRVDGKLMLHLPPGSRYLMSSLRASQVRETAAGLELTPDSTLVTVQLALTPRQEDTYVFSLPRVENNTGREGRLVVEEPDEGRIIPVQTYPRLPLSRLPAALQHQAGGAGDFVQLRPEEEIQLSLQRFTAVAAPDTVLDAMYFFVSFEENGGALAIIKMQLPDSAGPRLYVHRPAGAQVWSLHVNEHKKGVYEWEDNVWIVPLAKGKPSTVELAYRVQGEKLGLQGRLQTLLPKTGLPARRLFVGLALPARVEPVSVDGDFSPDNGKDWPLPASFIGKPYFFSHAFYTGEGLKAEVYYKEPVGQ